MKTVPCQSHPPVRDNALLIWFVCCVCLQHDNLVPTMTSWESLSFYAGIILPPTTSAEKKRKRIQEVLEMMGLAHARDTLVGAANSAHS